jgi:hypothetical protein
MLLAMNCPLIRHREQSAAIHRRKGAGMDCRASLAMTERDSAASMFVCRSETELAARNDASPERKMP